MESNIELNEKYKVSHHIKTSINSIARAVRKKILYVGMVTKETPASTAVTMTTVTMNNRDPRDRAIQLSVTTMRSVCTTEMVNQSVSAQKDTNYKEVTAYQVLWLNTMISFLNFIVWFKIPNLLTVYGLIRIPR